CVPGQSRADYRQGPRCARPEHEHDGLRCL
ncbi:hypothetical protein BN1708_019855, partial [Verticillium longisporum]